MAEYLDFDWSASRIASDIVKEHAVKFNDQKDIQHATQSLKKLINTCDDHELKNAAPQDDNTLRKFLYARKLKVQESFELFKNWYWYRRRNRELFENFTLDAEDIRKALENGLPGVLTSKDRRGRTVLVITANNWDCSYGLAGIYRALWFSLEHLVEEVHIQANGFVIIVDWTEFSFKQTTNLKPSVIKLMIEGLQDCFPAKFKGVHFVGQPWYVETALAFIKPFLKDYIKDRIYVHGNNLSTLHELVHKDILPAEMGGEQPSYNPGSFLNRLESRK